MKSLIDYLSRVGKARGFGIQSPWAYSFVRDVIMEKLRYYEYDNIEKKNLNRDDEKKEKLYWRLKNFVYGHSFSVFRIAELPDVLSLMDDYDSDGVICLEGIRENKENEEKWEKFKALDSVGVTFDLYDLAIVFPRNTLNKQHYKLNFR